MKNNSNTFDQDLQSIIQEFSQKLPGKIQQAEDLWQKLSTGRWKNSPELSDDLIGFRHLIHNIVGMAGTFGVMDVSDRAHELELLLDQAIEKEDEPDTFMKKQIYELLERLKIVGDAIKTPLSIVFIDDEPLQSRYWKVIFKNRYGDKIQVLTYDKPQEAITHLGPHISFLIIDWMMPSMDGAEVLEQAKRRGVSYEKIIIMSARSAEHLHQRFKMGECLAVIEKGDIDQKEALFNILDELVQKHP